MVVVGILSGKGGVGKTTVTTNIATALTTVFGRKTLILDTNVTSSHIRLHFGMYEEMKSTLKDIIRDESKLRKVVRTNELTGVDIVPSPETLRGLDLERLKNLASHLATSEYNFVIIDSAPGFRENVPNIIKASDQVIIVTNPYVPDVTDALKLLELVKKYSKKVTVVINRIKKKKYELGKEEIKDMLGVKKIFEIQEDEKVPESIAAGVPAVIYKPSSKAAVAFKQLAGLLIGKEYKPSIGERIKWFFGF